MTTLKPTGPCATSAIVSRRSATTVAGAMGIDVIAIAPAAVTSRTRSGVTIVPIGALWIGTWQPTRSVNGVRSILASSRPQVRHERRKSNVTEDRHGQRPPDVPVSSGQHVRDPRSAPIGGRLRASITMTTNETDTPTPLADLPALLAEEPAVRAVIDREPVVAVPEPARALFLAALTRVTTRRPILVTVPTAAEAERVAHDLSRYLGRDAVVELFPAWETLPFERVSPSLDTMGRRLRVIWKLRAGGEDLPAVVVAPVRALVQRLGPRVEDVEPIRIRTGEQVDRDGLVERLVAYGYRREYQVEARGEVAVRGSIVDVYPATDDHPVRVDLWGDEVDRLSRFSVADQRSTGEIDEAWLFPARELLPTPEVRERATGLVGREPWGREQWERLADGQVFDGMESWLPWLSDREHLLPDLLPDDALVLLVEPKRTRDRAQELLDDEAALGSTLSATWGATSGREFPRLSLPFDRLLAHTKAGATALLAAPESPDTPLLAGTGFDPVVGDTEGLTRRLRDLRNGGARVVLAADGEGTAGRLHDVLAGEGVT